MIKKRSIWFEAQTGIIRSQRSELSNFYQYELNALDADWLNTLVSSAVPGCGGLQYPDGTLQELDRREQAWKRLR